MSNYLFVYLNLIQSHVSWRIRKKFGTHVPQHLDFSIKNCLSLLKEGEKRVKIRDKLFNSKITWPRNFLFGFEISPFKFICNDHLSFPTWYRRKLKRYILYQKDWNMITDKMINLSPLDKFIGNLVHMFLHIIENYLKDTSTILILKKRIK